ncbi:serine hydrolase domain-containing protein [Kitasatospora sp. NPDC088391]|uniref:serine hydrolase domain-containing protein n=1 Tax=Kitasatospora sp. NPDC088391 TaxID=3364074 RepID=UPI003829ED94
MAKALEALGRSDGLSGLGGFDEFCEGALAEHGCASVSVAVVDDERTVLARAYGLADVAEGRAATPGTVYGLASATKPFTALAVCLAADAGLLDLDAPLPGRHRFGAPTARQLARHRGGFPAYYDFRYADAADAGRPVDVARYAEQVRAPGGAFEYSNLGYRELGLLLERVTGRPPAAYLRERIAEPLGLDSFSLGPVSTGAGPVAARYTADGRAYPVCRSSHPTAGEGWATATDLARFARHGAGLLAPGTAAARHDALPIPGRLGYGLGLVVQRTADGEVMASHGGGMGGVAAMLIDLPGRGLSAAVLANSTNKAARDAVVGRLAAALAPGFDTAAHLAPVQEPARPFALAPGRWAGAVDTAEGGVLLRLVVRADGRVEVGLADRPALTVPAVASADWDVRLTAPLQLPTADARRNSPALGLELRAEEGRLTGRAIAFKDGDRSGLLGPYLVHDCTLRPV